MGMKDFVKAAPLTAMLLAALVRELESVLHKVKWKRGGV